MDHYFLILKKIAGACNIFANTFNIFQDFQKVVEYIPQLLKEKKGVMKYIPQLFENNAGVVEYIPQLLHYSITCPSKC